MIFLEINSPEVRRRRQKLHAHPIAPLTGFPQKDNAAFLFFLGLGVDQNQHLAMNHLMAQIQQPAMRADHQSFADLAKLSAVVAAVPILGLAPAAYKLTR